MLTVTVGLELSGNSSTRRSLSRRYSVIPSTDVILVWAKSEAAQRARSKGFICVQTSTGLRKMASILTPAHSMCPGLPHGLLYRREIAVARPGLHLRPRQRCDVLADRFHSRLSRRQRRKSRRQPRLHPLDVADQRFRIVP